MVKIPTKLEDLVPPATFGKILDVLNQPAISGAVREALNRVGLKDASPIEQVQEAWQQAKDWVGQVASRFHPSDQSNPQWVNATGELIRLDGFGFPMAPSVAEAFANQAIHFHDHGSLEDACRKSAESLFEGYESVFTSSLAAAVLATLQEFGRGLVSRADMVRIPGFGDVRSMMLASSKPLVEVGVTNGATADDWATGGVASGDAIFMVSPNGLDSLPAVNQRLSAVESAKNRSSTLVELLIDGVVTSTSTLALPQIAQRLESGTDIVIVPLDGFIGGPAGAAIIGKGKWLKSIRSFVVGQSWNLRGPALAAASTAFDRAKLTNIVDTGILDLMNVSIANLRDRAKRISLQVNATEKVLETEIVDRSNALGPSPWNRYKLDSVALSIKSTIEIGQLMQKLSAGENGPSILCASTADRLLIDLRYVPPRDDHEIVRALLD
jgi:seryl-tRNA(Sec) selenium transferase